MLELYLFFLLYFLKHFTPQLTLHNSGLPLAESVYNQACSALNDDYEGVRLAAIQLIWVLSHLYPEKYASYDFCFPAIST